MSFSVISLSRAHMQILSSLQVKYCVCLCVLRPVFAAWMREKRFPLKPRGRFLIILKHVTTCNGMHTDRLPSADAWWFQGWLRWKRNRKVSTSHANSRQFSFLLQGEGRCWWHSCRVRAPQQCGHMVQINHLIFMGGAGGGGRRVTAARGGRSAAAGRLGTWRAATLLLRLWKHSRRHHYHCLRSQLGSATGPALLSVMWIW